MRGGRYIVIGLAAIMLAASVGSPLMGSPRLSDINGDRRVNILDVQMIAMALLGDRQASADINHDGRVDVLDFQTLVTETSAPATPIQKARAEAIEGYLSVSRAHVLAPSLDMRRCEAPAPAEHGLGLNSSSGRISQQIQPPGTEPTVRGPSPHSPPLPA